LFKWFEPSEIKIEQSLFHFYFQQKESFLVFEPNKCTNFSSSKKDFEEKIEKEKKIGSREKITKNVQWITKMFFLWRDF
jgi:hypothetical protein